MAFNATLTAGGAYAVTPSDTVSQSGVALYVGGAGAVTVKTTKGQTVAFAGCPAGFILPLNFGFVMATGTTATNLVAFLP